ncbi:hypothetical protein [Brevibacillus sp. DP1.3A]|uniref:hypothetical protein n=1 Tax=Brevibacillus sp. DP1.3A TaxID=2738867 RepID=UPI001D16DB7E|nr:hypothetical protein [Brevibacillus sp. DP1.3A]UED73233.1 hypothetical protein HP399_021170 [Brevibacillus sp. DP1.3A]
MILAKWFNKQFFCYALMFCVLFLGQSIVHAEDQYTKDLIPKMTSNTAPSGTAFSNSQYSSKYEAWRAFDGLNIENSENPSGDAGGAQSGDLGDLKLNPFLLGYEFPTEKTVVKYALESPNWSNGVTQMAKNWTFEGWDGTSWNILHTVENETNWKINEVRNYQFTNEKSYKKYQIRVTANNGFKGYVYIGELKMFGYEEDHNLVLSGNTHDLSNVLSWNSINGATSYNVKRSTNAGGPYETIATVTNTTYTDEDVEKGITYYYIVTAVNEDNEIRNSNEVALTPLGNTDPVDPITGDRALLVIKMISGLEKEFELTASEVQDFINWYNGRADGRGKETYMFDKDFNKGPFASRKDYVAFSKIQSFEVMEYTK